MQLDNKANTHSVRAFLPRRSFYVMTFVQLPCRAHAAEISFVTTTGIRFSLRLNRSFAALFGALSTRVDSHSSFVPHRLMDIDTSHYTHIALAASQCEVAHNRFRINPLTFGRRDHGELLMQQRQLCSAFALDISIEDRNWRARF